MIRRRKPVSDDQHIKKMIYRELLPQTKRAVPDFKVNKSMIRKRLIQGITFVAASKGRPPKGFITLLIKNDSLYVDMLAVRKADQGKGLGTILLTKAEQYGRRKGCGNAFLYVEQYNDRARQFYEKCGYSEVQYVPEIRCYLLSKELD